MAMAASKLVIGGVLLLALLGGASGVEILKKQEQLDEMIAEAWAPLTPSPPHSYHSQSMH